MINEIILENFLFMPKAHLLLSKGLNVITGETGAGKSIMLEAIKLLLGKKARSGMVLPGQTVAKIQAIFDITGQSDFITFLEELGFQDEENPTTLSISRTFKEEGTGRVLVNGIITTAAFLKQLGPYLMEIHGQNEHQTLLEPDIQRELLDRTGSKEHKHNLIKLGKIYQEYKKLQQKLQELDENQKNSANRISELQATLQELTALNLTEINEEEELKNTLKKLSHAEQIVSCLKEAFEMISGEDSNNGATIQLFRAAENLKRVSQFDTEIDEIYQQINSMYYDLKSIESEIKRITDSTELEPDVLYKIQSRLSEISRIYRKYSTDFAGLFKLSESVNKELAELFAPDSSKEKIAKELEKIESCFRELNQTISTERASLAEILNKQVSAEMESLGFNVAVFKAELKQTTPNTHGSENIEFCVSLNPGAPGGPLRKIASGGELSRVALAIKKVLAKCDALPTLVFDEIDSGIGGKTAEAVAVSLRVLGEEKQVLLVTHLHQIAKEGLKHFTVCKTVTNGQTHVEISEVTAESRVIEIARMLGKTDTDGIAFARNLLRRQSFF